MKKTYWLVILFSLGFLFRLWFANLVPQPFVFDQEEYYGFALGIIKEGLHADIYRLYGYPLIITPLIYFWGVKSALPWTVFHALIDSATALLVFWMAKKLFRREEPAWIAFAFYLFNPFTAGYVGVLLSEITTIFFVTLIFYFIFCRKNSLFLAFLLGFLPQIRPAFVYFSFLILLGLLTMKQMNKKRLIALLLFAMPFIYNVITNYTHYHELKILTVDRVFAREFYSSLFIGRGLAFTDTQFGVWPREAIQVWSELSQPKNAKERDVVAKKYTDLAFQKIQSDPIWYVTSRIAKMGYVWEKHFVFPYAQGKPSESIKDLTYWGNLAILSLGVIGLLKWIRDSQKMRWFGYLVVFLFVYISVIHSISTSEERFSLPAYPLIFLFAGYGIWILLARLKKLSTTG